MTILQIFFYDCHQLSILLPTSPQPSSGDHFRPKYTLKRDFGPICPNMVIWTQTPQKIKMLKFYFFIVISLVIRFQWALNHDLEIILTQDIDLFPIFHPFSPLCRDKYIYIGPVIRVQYPKLYIISLYGIYRVFIEFYSRDNSKPIKL